MLDGFLKNTLRYQVSDDELLFGTNRKYGAIHHFGGDIDVAARSQQAYFKQGKDGEVGNQFVSKRRSNFAQWVTIGAHKIHIPARPILGTSEEDNFALVNIAMKYLMPGVWGG
ncbi:Phage virion morphogenesis family protein [compost metagenome]